MSKKFYLTTSELSMITNQTDKKTLTTYTIYFIEKQAGATEILYNLSGSITEADTF